MDRSYNSYNLPSLSLTLADFLSCFSPFSMAEISLENSRVVGHHW